MTPKSGNWSTVNLLQQLKIVDSTLQYTILKIHKNLHFCIKFLIELQAEQ